MSDCCCEKNLLQHKLEELYCGDCCDVCICPCDSNSVSDICDCCVKPMQNLLKALNNKGVTLTQILLADGTVLVGTITINDVSDFNLKVTITGTTAGTFDIAICEISRIETTNPILADLIFVSESTRSCGECRCCERPMRKKLEDLKKATKNVSVFVLGKSGEFTITREIINVSLGILTTKFVATPNVYSAYSICKITGVKEI